MTKFKVGDRVRKVNNNYLGCFYIGEELIVDEISPLQNAWVTNGKERDTAYDEDLVLIEAEDLIGISKEDADTKFSETFSKPKTYTLTPYIKPETVTINGVEYIMTENV